MGILNVTPDSFSDGGRFTSLDSALRQAEQMISQGARIIDVGGESTRPGAQAVDAQQELDRVLPVIEAIHGEFDTMISVDTSKPAVMREAVSAGAGLINDVNALQADGALTAAAATGVPVCLMHMQGTPRTMQSAPSYADVVADIHTFLGERLDACKQAGIAGHDLLIDPGFGFGKTLEHNLQLLRRLGEFQDLKCPLLVGISRKSMLGAITGQQEPEKRLAASIAAAVIAVQNGAAIVRVHDVEETVDALKVLTAVRESE